MIASQRQNPNPMQPKRKQIVGRGAPSRSLRAEINQTYLDTESRRRWIMGTHGWELATELRIDVLLREKKDWTHAASSDGGLEAWVRKTLNRAVAK